MLKAAEQLLHEAFERGRRGRMAELVAELAAGTLSPRSAAKRLLSHIGMEIAR